MLKAGTTREQAAHVCVWEGGGGEDGEERVLMGVHSKTAGWLTFGRLNMCFGDGQFHEGTVLISLLVALGSNRNKKKVKKVESITLSPPPQKKRERKSKKVTVPFGKDEKKKKKKRDKQGRRNTFQNVFLFFRHLTKGIDISFRYQHASTGACA